MTATLTKWYEEHGRHEIFAGGKNVSLEEIKNDVYQLNTQLITNEEQRDLDKLGIAKTARDEKLRARDLKAKQEEDARMAKLYRQHILGEQPAPGGFVPVNVLAAQPASAAAPEPVKEEVLGD